MVGGRSVQTESSLGRDRATANLALALKLQDDQERAQQGETQVQEQPQHEQQCLSQQLEESRVRALELRAALTLQSAWRGRRGRARAEAQAVEMLQQNQEELNKLLAELELQQRNQQLAELQRLESQLAELQTQKQLSLSPTAAEASEEAEPPERASRAVDMGNVTKTQISPPGTTRAQVQLTSPVRTTTWSPNFGRHPSAAVFKEKDDLRWMRPRREN